MEKFIKLADIRKLNKQVSLGEISSLRMIEIINEKANEYAKMHVENFKMQVHGEELNEKKFEELARPMIKYLCENYHPHVTVIITPTNAELLQGLKSTGEVFDYLRD